MTLAEYAQDIAEQLRNAHDTKDLAAVDPIFRKADVALLESGIGETRQRNFWATVRAHFNASRLLIEKQANSALIALMHAIQKELAARENK